MERNKKHHLYRYYDKNNILLYVGISISAIYRLSQHKKHSIWFDDIATVKIETLASRDEAIDAEKKAISSENPLHNIMRPQSLHINKFENDATNSKNYLTKRIVHFNPIYNMTETGNVLGVSVSFIRRLIDEKKLSCIKVGSMTKITGWQIIDYIESLANKDGGS